MSTYRPVGEGTEKPGVFLMTDSFQVGGTERQFSLLARTLDDKLFQLRLGCLKRVGPFLQQAGDIEEFNLGGSFFKLQAQRARLTLGRHLRAAQIAIAHSFDFYSNLMLIPTARLAGVPVVIGSHRQLGDLLSPLQFRAQGMVFRLCDRVVCNSRAAADQLIAQGLPGRKVAVIRNGLSKDFFAQITPALPRLTGVLRVGLIARMNNRVKNHAGFLRAAARLANKFSAVEFLLVGDGPLRLDLEDLAKKLELEHRVRFLGERHDIPGLLAAMDISVIFSSSESLPNVALESMAGGIPVIATSVGGTPEVVREGETGLLVRPGDEEGLARALECLITEPSLRTELGQRGKQMMLSAFTMDRVVKQYEELYESLLDEKNWRPDHRNGRPVPAPAAPPKLRVAVVAASPRWIGGQGVQASLIIRNWQNDPVVDARFIPIDPELPLAIRWVERIPFLRTLIRMPFYLATLWREIQDADIVHIFSASYWSFLVAPMPAWLVARMRGKKTLIHYHSGEARDHLRRSQTAIRFLRRADRLIVPSDYLVDVFREFDLKAQAVANIADLDRFPYKPRRPLRPRMVNTRGLHPYYGIDVVVQAFSRVRKEYPEARLSLVGQGPVEKEIRSQAGNLESSGIEFAGPISRGKIAGFYDRNDIFVNGSWLDNAPVSILEAFSSGTPVVSTAPDGIRYMVEHGRTGLLCAPGDWQGLAENVIRLLRDPDLASRLALNAYEEVQRYRWELVRPLWLQVYRSMCPLSCREEPVRQQHSSPLASTDSSNLTKEELPERPAAVGP